MYCFGLVRAQKSTICSQIQNGKTVFNKKERF